MQYVTAPRTTSEMFKETCAENMKTRRCSRPLDSSFYGMWDQRFVCILIFRSAEPEITQLRDD